MHETELLKRFDELKSDRAKVRKAISETSCSLVESAARGGFLPTYDGLMTSIMGKISELIDDHPDFSDVFWSVMLQKKDPDASCPKTMKLLNRTILTEEEAYCLGHADGLVDGAIEGDG